MRRFFVFYSPEGDGGGNGSGGSGDPAGGAGASGAAPNGGSGGSNGNGGGNGFEALYKDKIDSLHTDLGNARALNKSLGEKLSAAEAKVAVYELAEKKSGLLKGVQEKLGDFEIPGDKLDKLNGLIKVLPDGDDLGDRITEMVDLVKVPKSTEERKPFSSFSGGTPTGTAPTSNKEATFTPGQKLTAGELANLSQADMQKYLRSQAQ